ncbi:helicase HerA domain-containing protein [Dactylosporangium sp. CA-139066]|uniref:helicase HerA domain-containing protein n=1 Tax=Dactylosporangium sp. CA-139066 TaxID=3239930 RepID=UPI003D94B884
MSDTEIKALTGLRIKLVPTRDDVWRRSEFHVDTLHRDVAQTILEAIDEARDSTDGSPVGVVVQGQRGSGKTHLLGWVREQVQRQDGYFFLVSLLDGARFWHSVAHSMLNGLTRQVDGHETQLRIFLRRITLLTGVPFAARQAAIGEAALDRDAVDATLEALHRYSPEVAMACRHTARALIMYNAGDFRAREVGNNFLLSGEECEPGERAPWGLPREVYPPESVVGEISSLLSLTGPSVIAVDQIDGLLAPLAKAMANGQHAEWQDSVLLDQITNGLMSLREATRKTLTVVAAQHATWEVIKKYAISSVQDRFRATHNLGRIPTAAVGQALVAKRLEAHYRSVDFSPPYATWPIHEDAFDDAVNFMPRQLLQVVDQHIRECVRDGEIRVMTSLETASAEEEIEVPPVVRPPDANLKTLDKRFDELKASATGLDRALDEYTDDAELPGLLAAGLQAWIIERGEAGRHFEQDPPPSTKPALHARLRRTLDDTTEEEAHWGFRGISTRYHATAVLNRIRSACTEAGLVNSVEQRRLFLLRNGAWPKSPKNVEALALFEAGGGRTLPVSEDDLRTLAALRELLTRPTADLTAWLIARQPTKHVSFLRDALADAAADLPAPELAMPGEHTPAERTPGEPSTPIAAATAEPAAPQMAGPALTLGHTFDDAAVPVGLEALRKHTAIFAGSGSGKTVLIRRIIEECALQGVSAIVLDPNNDLARLGDPWPEPPAGWREGDAEKARDYLDQTDVVVYTPRREAGRPISFQPLPDFHSFIDDADEFEAAIEAALATLAPRAKVDGKTGKAERGRAVLKEALVHYARRQPHTTLRGFIEMLDDLPEDVSDLVGAVKIAAELGQTLTAAMVIDPLFGGAGEAVDPGELLTPAAGKRARVSVISFIGLPGDEQRQSFVNQLQMALFAWIKKHPAGDRPLGGLFVMDEAQTLAPSGAMTACTKSTLALASQARKYGLGLMFATQSPKGLHNQIPGNAATQCYGLLNAPVQIDAAREMARAKGGDVPDISQLRTGQFYVALEGQSFAKVRTPLCLSHHPKSPLTTEEVLQRARAH